MKCTNYVFHSIVQGVQLKAESTHSLVASLLHNYRRRPQLCLTQLRDEKSPRVRNIYD